MPQDARNKLRNMGGIMASYPELMQAAAQRYQDGGPVMASPVVPRVDSVTVPGVSYPVVGLGRVPPMQPQRPVAGVASLSIGSESPGSRIAAGGRGITMQDWQSMSRREREAAGFPVSDLGGQLFFDRFGVGMGLVEPDARYTSEGPVPPADPVEELLRESSAVNEQTERPVRPSDLPGLSAGEVGAPETPEPRSERQEPRLAEPEPSDDMEPTETPEVEEEAAPPVMQSVGQALEDPEKRDRIQKAAADSFRELTSGAPKSELRKRYDERLELYQDIFGTDDKRVAQDRAMSLAMMGLAIAAGQSPDALTNIAQGTMVGLQGMGQQEASQRQADRELKQSAFESVLQQMENEADRMASGGRDYGKATNPISAAIRIFTSKSDQASDEFTPLGREMKNVPPDERRRRLIESTLKDLEPIYGANTPELQEVRRYLEQSGESATPPPSSGGEISEDEAAKALGL